MQWDNLYIAGIGTYLPEHVETADEAIAQGRYTAQKKAVNDYRAVRVAAPGQSGPLMAAIAGREALSRSGVDPATVGLTVFSYIGHPGYDMWIPASYVQRETVGGPGSAYEVKQGCNGFMAGLESAASFLAARPDEQAALVTGGDAFRLPYLDRWGSHSQNVDGDGAGAIMLSKVGGFARVLSMVSFGDSQLEPMARTAPTWTDTPFPGGETLSLDTSLQDYMRDEEVDLDDVVARISAGVRISVETALEEAGAELDDIRFFLHQQLAEPIATFGIYNLLGVDRAKTTYDWGKQLSMVGTVDLVLGLNHVIEERQPKAGDLILLQSAGAGYVWTAAVVEILETPPWSQG